MTTCTWIFLPSLEDKRERLCAAPADRDSRYCPTHNQEMATFIASADAAITAQFRREHSLRTALQQWDFSGAQFEANIALDDIYIAVQRIRELVNQAETYRRTAWDASLWSLENDLREATTWLREATQIIRKLLHH